MRTIRQFAAIGVCVMQLAGCTNLWNKVDTDAHADASQAGRALGKLSQGDNRSHDPDDVIVRDDLWLSGNTLKIAAKSTLPNLFNEPASFDGTVEREHRVARSAAVADWPAAGAIAAGDGDGGLARRVVRADAGSHRLSARYAAWPARCGCRAL
jgi:hypothetical protein